MTSRGMKYVQVHFDSFEERILLKLLGWAGMDP